MSSTKDSVAGYAEDDSDLGSVAMDESSDEEANQVASAKMASLYPLDGKFIDAADRSKVLSLPELQREELLAQRAKELEEERFRAQLILRTQRPTAQSPSPSKKRRASDEESDSPSKNKKTKHGAALQQLKQSRNDRAAGRADRPAPRTDRSPSSEYEEESPPRNQPTKPTHTSSTSDRTADPRDIQSIFLRRDDLYRLCATPGFEDAATGAFVRLQVSPREYRAVQIKSFVTGKPYKLENSKPGSPPIYTDLYMHVQPGLSGTKQAFNFISNSQYHPSEWSEYNRRIADSKGAVRLPTHAFCIAKATAIHAVTNHNWTNEEINARLTRQNRLSDPSYVKRLQLREARRQAEMDGDDEEVARIDAEFSALDNNKSTPITKTAAPKAKTREQERDEKFAAQAREERRIEAEQTRLASEEKMRKKLEAARLKKRAEEAAKLEAERKASEAKEAEAEEVAKNGDKSNKAKKVVRNDDEAIAALDLELDIDI